MDKLWAPWRIEYVRQKKVKGCLFCRIAKQKKDEKNLIILRSSSCFVVLNRFPYNNGHLLIAPYAHKQDLEKFNEKEIIDFHQTTIKVKKMLAKSLKPHAFNLGFNLGQSAGAGILGHVHLHLVPRWQGDTNFMPTLFQTKIISQSLQELYKTLKEIK